MYSVYEAVFNVFVDFAVLESAKHRPKEDVPASKKEIPLSAYIISGQFWPPLREEKIKLPSDMETVRSSSERNGSS